ncbi:hypothetical protein K435DRAFT_132215 [Dendrothele bispora CBS 962.96]|uniref:Secreted protein n=1 Tax=Dendrothele bispora (strain CBS 962.96) TaxID=1314807 RepID=A0A4S8M053_DENBC|nr:hypothetical protein K435DRAFT_132215 [Dendrothele bispora CBS 962.96]
MSNMHGPLFLICLWCCGFVLGCASFKSLTNSATMLAVIFRDIHLHMPVCFPMSLPFSPFFCNLMYLL